MARDTHSFSDMDWQKLQAQYLDALQSFTKDMGARSHVDPARAPWLQALAFWPSSDTAFDAKSRRDVLANLLGQSQVFYSMAEQFRGLLDQLSAMPDDSDEWQAALGDHFEKIKQQFVQPPRTAPADMAQLWQQNLQAWLEAFSASSVLPGAFPQQEKPAFPDINTFFSTPGSGPGRDGRDYWERLQRCAKLWQTCLENYREYEQILSAIGRDSIDRLHEKIMRMAAADKKIHSLRELYGLWIHAQEEVYATVVFTEEYAELHGRLINSLMEFRRHQQGMFAEIFSALDLPTHEDLQNISKAQQQLRRAMQTHESEVAALKKELAQMRQSLAGVRGGRNKQKKHE